MVYNYISILKHALLATPQEAYCNMLVKFHEEMARPIQEATEFFNSMERQLGSTISGNYFISICSVSDR